MHRMFTRQNTHPTAVFALACAYSEIHLLLPLRVSLGGGSWEVAACSSAMVTASCSAACQRAPSLPACEGSKCSKCQIVLDCHESALISPGEVLYQGLQVSFEGRKRNNSHQMCFGFFFFNSERLKNAFSLALPPSAKLLSCSAV